MYSKIKSKESTRKCKSCREDTQLLNNSSGTTKHLEEFICMRDGLEKYSYPYRLENHSNTGHFSDIGEHGNGSPARSYLLKLSGVLAGKLSLLRNTVSKACKASLVVRLLQCALHAQMQELEKYLSFDESTYNTHIHKVVAIVIVFRQLLQTWSFEHKSRIKQMDKCNVNEEESNGVLPAIEYCKAGNATFEMKVETKSSASEQTHFLLLKYLVLKPGMIYVSTDLSIYRSIISTYLSFDADTCLALRYNKQNFCNDDDNSINSKFFNTDLFLAIKLHNSDLCSTCQLFNTDLCFEQDLNNNPDFIYRPLKCKQWLNFDAIIAFKDFIENLCRVGGCFVQGLCTVERYIWLWLLKLLQVQSEVRTEPMKIYIEPNAVLEHNKEPLIHTTSVNYWNVNTACTDIIAMEQRSGVNVEGGDFNTINGIEAKYLVQVATTQQQEGEQVFQSDKYSCMLESEAENKTQLKMCDISQLEVSKETSVKDVKDKDYFSSKDNDKNCFFDESNDSVLSIRRNTWLFADDLPRPDLNINLIVFPVTQFEPLMAIINKIADGHMPPPQVTMRYEILRLCTFRTYPKENKPFVLRFAQAGFYYAAKGDEVVCYCCAGRKSGWTENDISMDIHRDMSPSCSFLLRNGQVNVPVSKSQGDSQLDFVATKTVPTEQIQSASPPLGSVRNNNMHQTAAENICAVATNTDFPISKLSKELSCSNIPQNVSDKFGANGYAQDRSISFSRSQAYVDQADVMHNATRQLTVTDNLRQTSNASLSPGMFSHSHPSTGDVCASQQSPLEHNRDTSNRPRETSSAPVPLPKHPKFETQVARLDSFRDCTVTIVVTRESLVDAGFFYAGFGDCVRCFYCGIGLRNWTDEDDPWIEHARWSKDCVYVKQSKGQEFINLVQLAIQYTRDQEDAISNDNTVTQFPREEVDRILLTPAAQSVLDMGYTPEVIRRAIRALLNDNDGQNNITTHSLMEKVLAIQSAESTTENQSARGNHAVNITTAQPVNRSHGALSMSTHNSLETSLPAKQDVPAKKRQLKQENVKLKEQSICKVCKQNNVCIVFLPCGHLVTCETCAPKVERCPVCQTFIKGTVRTYLT